MPQPTDQRDALLFAGRPDVPGPASCGWSPRRRLAIVVLLAAGSWAGLGGLAFAAVKLAEWETVTGLLRFVPLI